MLRCYLYIFFGEVSVKVFCSLFKNIILFIYLFTFDYAGSSLWHQLSLVVVCRLLISVASLVGSKASVCWASPAAARMGSVVVASGLYIFDFIVVLLGFTYSAAYGIFLGQGLNPCVRY